VVFRNELKVFDCGVELFDYIVAPYPGGPSVLYTYLFPSAARIRPFTADNCRTGLEAGLGHDARRWAH
jgi:hypothetical protein